MSCTKFSSEKCRHERKKSVRKKIFENTQEFAESTTIHGFAYMAEKKHSAWRPVWVIVVVLALAFTTWQVTSLYKEWQDEPVVTTLETVAEPIEEIEFPAVTICPQGSRQEILDSVLYRQFKEYIGKKPGKNSKLNPQEMVEQVEDFLRHVYPGVNGQPTDFVKLLTSDNPKSTIQNDAVLGLDEKCDPSSNDEIVATLNKDLNNDSCPDGFEMLGALYCVHTPRIQMTNNEANQYCDDQGGAKLLYLDSYEDLHALNKYIVAGNRFNI